MWLALALSRARARHFGADRIDEVTMPLDSDARSALEERRSLN